MLRLLGAFKLVKALALVAFAVSLMDPAWRHELRVLVRAVGVDPDHRLADVIAKLRDMGEAHRRDIGLAVLAYAALFTVEGVGLIMRKLWAEYVTIVITTSFIPLEIYELAHGKSVLKAVVIALNIAIVIYLILRLRHNKRWPFH